MALDTSMISIPMTMLVHIKLSGLTLYIADKHITLDDGNYYDKRISLSGRFVQRFQSITENKIPLSTFTLTIDNKDGVYNDYLADYDWSMKEVNICIGTGTVFADYEIVFSGFVKSNGAITKGENVSVIIVDAVEHDNVHIPTSVYTVDDFPNLDTVHSEQHAPIWYGDYTISGTGMSTLPIPAYAINAAADGTTSIFEVAGHTVGAIEQVQRNGTIVAHSLISLGPRAQFSIPTYAAGSDIVTVYGIGKTGTGINLGGVTTLTHPLDILYDLLTTVTGVTTARINTNNFLTTKVATSTLMARRVINEGKPANDYVAELINEMNYDIYIDGGSYHVQERTIDATTTTLLRWEDAKEHPVGVPFLQKHKSYYIQGFYNYQPAKDYFQRSVVAQSLVGIANTGMMFEREYPMYWVYDNSQASDTVSVEVLIYDDEQEYVYGEFANRAINLKVGDTVTLDLAYWSNINYQVREVDRNYDNLTTRLTLWSIPDVDIQALRPDFVTAHVNRGGAGNNIIDLEFDYVLTLDSGDWEDGFTIEVQATGADTTWYTIDAANYTATVVDSQYIRFTLAGLDVLNLQAGHTIRTSYNSGSGGINNLSTFTNNTNTTNNSTIDLLDSLKSYWIMDETSGNRTDDFGGHILTQTGSVGYWDGGSEDYSAKFIKGEGTNFELAHHADHLGGDVHYLVACRVRFNSITGDETIVAKRTAADNEVFRLKVNTAGNRLEAEFNDTLDNWVTVTANTFGAIAVDTWYHIWMWHDPDANVFGIKVNGTEDTTAETDGLSTDTATLVVGAEADETQPFDGMIDDLAIWRGHSAVKSADEWTSWYNAGTGNNYPFVPKDLTISTGNFEFERAIVSRGAAGNHIIDLRMSHNINSPGADYELGWTIGVQATGADTTWYNLSASTYTTALQDLKYVRITNAGNVKDFQASHSIRVSYNSATGDIERSSDSTALATFTNNTTVENNSTVDLLDSLKSYWIMDETTGNRTDDFGSHALVPTGSVGYWDGGISDYSAKFIKGEGTNLELAHHADHLGGDVHYLVGVRVRFNSLTGDETIVAKRDAADTEVFRLKVNTAGNRLEAEFNDTLDNWVTVTANTFGAIAIDTWYHVWMWHDPDADVFGIKVNGTEDTTAETDGLSTDTAKIVVGAEADETQPLDGMVDEFVIWRGHSAVMSAAEWTSWYNAGTGNKYPFVPGNLTVSTGNFEYERFIVNRGAAGNKYLDVRLSHEINSPGADYELGWTIGVQATGNDTTWYNLDATTYTTAKQDLKYVRFTMAGDITDFQASHSVRISYVAATGDIERNSDSTALGNITNDTNHDNNSTVDLLDGLVSYWDMDEESGSRTDAYAGHILTATGTVGWASGLAGRCATFAGTDANNLEMAHHADHVGADAHYNVSVRVRFDTLTGDEIIVQKKDAANDELFIIKVNAAGNRIEVNYNDAGDVLTTVTANTFGAIAVDTWYHVFAWHDPDANVIGVMVNGTSDTTALTTGLSTDACALTVGGDESDANEIDGRIDGFGIWNARSAVLSSAEWTSWYNGGLGNDYPFIPGDISITAPPISYSGAHINRSSAGNDKLDLQFTSAPNSPTSDYETGFTVECREPSGTWTTIAATAYSAAVVDTNYIRYTMTGTVTTFQASHEIRISYNEAVGNIDNLATFSDITTLTNSSTIDLLASLAWAYNFDEASGNALAAYGGLDLTDNNTVQAASAPASHLGSARKFSDTNNESFSYADNTAFEVGGQDVSMYVIINFTTSTGSPVFAGKYESSKREWRFRLNGSAEINLDYTVDGSTQESKNAGTFGGISTGTWYGILIDFDHGTDVGISVNNSTRETRSETNTIYTGTSTFGIGTGSGGGGGDVDADMALFIRWNKLLSAAEKTDLHNSGNFKQYPFIPE